MLLESALAIAVLWLLLAATLDLGRALAAAHVLQSAARSAARELALAVAPASAGFHEVLEGRVEGVSAAFDPHYLVVDADCLEERARSQGRTPEAELAALLAGRRLNLMLRPLMVFERVRVGGVSRHLLRYPGALLDSGDEPDLAARPCTTRYTVGVPEVDEEGGRITWHAVVEEIADGAYRVAGGAGGPGEPAIPPGTVALRLHYPFQAAGLSSWRLVATAPGGGIRGRVYEPVAADTAGAFNVSGTAPGSTLDELDAGLEDGAPDAYALGERGDAIPVYGGSLGLGFQAVLGRVVRPYRRVLTAQAVYPRELIGPGPGA